MSELTEGQWVSFVALAGMLILAVSSFRGHNVNVGRGFMMAGTWAGIFAIVVLVIQLLQ